MDFKTYKRSLDAIGDWRIAEGKSIYLWPDSRDPALTEFLSQHGVVPQDLEKAIMALAAWRHGHDEGYQGMSAVAKVIVNRQNAGMFRTHTTDQDQFPMMCSLNFVGLDIYPEEADNNFIELLKQLEDILTLKVVDLTQGALYFWYVGGNMPEWFKKIITEKTRTVKIGNLTFYK